MLMIIYSYVCDYARVFPGMLFNALILPLLSNLLILFVLNSWGSRDRNWRKRSLGILQDAATRVSPV